MLAFICMLWMWFAWEATKFMSKNEDGQFGPTSAWWSGTVPLLLSIFVTSTVIVLAAWWLLVRS